MVQKADGSDNLALGNKTVLGRVAGVANHDGGRGGVVTRFNSSHLSVCVESNFVDLSVEHVGAAMDGAQSRKGLWQATQTIDWVQEATITVLSNRLQVQLHFSNDAQSWLIKVRVRVFKGYGVAEEVNRVFCKPVVFVHVLHGDGSEVESTPSFWIVNVDGVDKFVHVDEALLFEQTHQVRFQGLHIICWNLADRHLGVGQPASLLLLDDIA